MGRPSLKGSPLKNDCSAAAPTRDSRKANRLFLPPPSRISIEKRPLLKEKREGKEDRRENIDFLPVRPQTASCLRLTGPGERADSMQRGAGRGTNLFGLRERLLFWFTTFTAGQTLHWPPRVTRTCACAGLLFSHFITSGSRSQTQSLEALGNL